MTALDDPIDRCMIGDGVSAAVYECPLAAGLGRGPLARAWVFVSAGLEQFGQREIAVGVLRDRQEEPDRYPQFPLWLFKVAAQHARRGSRVDSGGRTILGSPGSDVDGRLAGFLYSDHPRCVNQLPASARVEGRWPLLAVPLLSGEAEAAEYVGHARVLTLLGHQARYYPFPWWFEPGREPVIDHRLDVQPSILSRVAVLSAPYLEVGRRGIQLEIALHPDKCGDLYEALESGPDALGLLPRISHTSHSHLIWRPGQQEQNAIGAKSSSMRSDSLIGGNFLILVHGDLDSHAQALEDGFGVVLSQPLWRQLLEAITARKAFRTHISGPMIEEFILRIGRTTINSPFGEYRTGPGTFVESLPSGTQLALDRPVTERRIVDLERTVLLMDDQQANTAVDPESLSSFIHDTLKVVDDALDGAGSEWAHLVINVRLTTADGVTARLAADGEALPDRLLQRLVDRLQRLPLPAGLRDEIDFELWVKPVDE